MIIVFPVIDTTQLAAWRFIYGTVNANTVLDHVTVEYGGQGGAYSNANLVLNQTSPTIMNCTIRNSAGSGVYVTDATNNPVIVYSNITGNTWGVYSSSSNPSVMHNNIYANATAGVWNATTSPDVDARENWWGVATGPTYTAGNPGGRGDSISDHVLYNPWLGQATGSLLSITETRAMPTALNPNGGYITFTAHLSSSATWTITISDGNSNIVKTYTGSGTSIIQKWYGVDSQSIKVADGPYYYRIDAHDPASGASASTPEWLFMVSSEVPIVYMDPPVDNQMFTGGATINITGTVSDTDFKNYTLDYGVGGNPDSWTTLRTASTPVTDSLITTWNTSALTNDLYTLRLTATDYANNVVVDTARVRLLWIQNAAVSQSYISPNGDGIQDAANFSAAFSYPSAWTIALKDSSDSPVKTYTGTAATLSQDWDGKNDAGAIVADGIYTYQITAVSSETGIPSAPTTGIISVDTTRPTALITTPVANSVLWNTVLITGSALDVNIAAYMVEYGPSTGSGPWTVITSGTSSVTNNTLATWSPNDPSLPSPVPNGNYIIRLTVTDKAGNSSIASVPVILDNVQLTNVGASSNSIDTSASQSSSIYFTINSSATVTLKVIPEKLGPTGAPIYQASQACAAAGPYSFTWNGQDSTGKAVPDEAYIYILEAGNGIKTFRYDPPAPTGTGSVSCTKSIFSPEKNIPMTISYSVTQPERVTINISWGPQNFVIVNNMPYETGSYTFNWNGLDPNGNALDNGAAAICSDPSLIRANHIITTGDTPKVSGLTADPYALSLSYGQFTRVSYTLSRDSLVTVSIISSTGTTIATLSNNALQAAGAHEIEWNGIDPGDTTGKGLVIPGEGAYIISVQATNSVTGSSSTARGLVTVNY